MKANDDEFLSDSLYSVAFDAFKVSAAIACRLFLYGVGIAALCFATVVRVLDAWVAGGTVITILIMLAATCFLAGWALRRAANLKAELERRDDIGFCPPGRFMGSVSYGFTKPTSGRAA